MSDIDPNPLELDDPHHLNMADIERDGERMDVFEVSMVQQVYDSIQQYNRVLEQARTFHTFRAEYGDDVARRVIFMHYGIRRYNEKRTR